MDGIYPIEYFIASYCKLNSCPVRNMLSILDRHLNDILTDTLADTFEQNIGQTSLIFFERSFYYFLHDSSLLINWLLSLSVTTTSNSLNFNIISDAVASEQFKIFLTSDALNTLLVSISLYILNILSTVGSLYLYF